MCRLCMFSLVVSSVPPLRVQSPFSLPSENVFTSAYIRAPFFYKLHSPTLILAFSSFSYLHLTHFRTLSLPTFMSLACFCLFETNLRLIFDFFARNHFYKNSIHLFDQHNSKNISTEIWSTYNKNNNPSTKCHFSVFLAQRVIRLSSVLLFISDKSVCCAYKSKLTLWTLWCLAASNWYHSVSFIPTLSTEAISMTTPHHQQHIPLVSEPSSWAFSWADLWCAYHQSVLHQAMQMSFSLSHYHIHFVLSASSTSDLFFLSGQ